MSCCSGDDGKTKKSDTQSLYLLVGLIVIALSMAIVGFKIYDGLKFFRSYDRYVTVKGLATKDVQADLAVWTLNFTVTGNDLVEAQNNLQITAQKVTAYLNSFNLKDENIRLQNIVVADKQAQTYSGQDSGGPRYVLSQAFIVRTNTIADMMAASQNIAQLLKDGVVLGQPNGGWNPSPQYIFTKLNDIKPEMIAQATQNAREAAEQFAKDSGQEVGQIRSANQGVFEILARDSAVAEGETPDKTIRVVSTVDYYLAD
jgi:uncharacterized protein